MKDGGRRVKDWEVRQQVIAGTEENGIKEDERRAKKKKKENNKRSIHVSMGKEAIDKEP